jgi:hypothetical protein
MVVEIMVTEFEIIAYEKLDTILEISNLFLCEIQNLAHLCCIAWRSPGDLVEDRQIRVIANFASLPLALSSGKTILPNSR